MADCSELRGQLLAEFLGGLCAANQAVMLSPLRAGRPVEGAPVRLLELQGTTLVVDQPRAGGAAIELAPGDEVEIGCGLEVGLFRCRATVRGPWKTQEGCSAPRLALAAPERAEVIQRRGAFRVVLLETNVTIEPWPPRTAGVVSVWGQVLNLSAGGAAITIDRKDIKHLGNAERYRISFEETPGAALRVFGRIVREAEAPSAQHVLLGVAWALDSSRREDRVIQDRLAKFAAARQRPSLRRRSFRI